MADRNDNGSFAQGNGIIAAAIVVAALIISWGQPDTPRYQIAGAGNMVVRLDTDSGALIGCDPQGCRRIEAPDRAKTLGPLRLEFGDGNQAEPKQLPASNRQ